MMKNWWHYNKWYVICGAVLLGIICNLAGSYLGLWEKQPDFQIAYIGKVMLLEDTVSALETAFSSLGNELDFNQDGEVLVKVNQYISSGSTTAPELAQYAYAAEITLTADINDCESYFFLMEDAEQFQRDFHVLARFDGSCPEDADASTEDKTVLWADCAALSGLKLGSCSVVTAGETITKNSQELLADCSFGRRCFYTERRTDYAEKCDELWDSLIDKN